MGVQDAGKEYTAYLVGGSKTDKPTYFGIGSGSGTIISTGSTLFNEYSAQRRIFTSTDNTIPKFITWQSDYDSVTMSGLSFREFGLFTSATGGTLWNKENLGNAITFDGSNELRVEIQWEFY